MKRIVCFFLVLAITFITGCSTKIPETQATNNSADITYSNSAPKIIILSFAELKSIDDALNSMNPEEFEKYMSEEKDALVMNGMQGYESSKMLVDELKETTVVMMNNELSFNSKFSFYHERNEVHVFSELSEEKRIACYAFTPQRGTTEEYGMSSNENLKFLSEIKKDGVTLKLYDSLYEDRGFHMETKVDNTYITFWINQRQTFEEFEADFARLEFVKIGDLLNEFSTETTQVLEESTVISEETEITP